MRSLKPALSLLVCLPTALAGSAPIVTGNPIGSQYLAKLPDRNDTTVRGAVVINTSPDGTGGNVQVSISGLPGDGGPFSEDSPFSHRT